MLLLGKTDVSKAEWKFKLKLKKSDIEKKNESL